MSILLEALSSHEREDGNLTGGRAFAIRLDSLRKENLLLKELLREALDIIWHSLNLRQREIFLEASRLLINDNPISLNKLSQRLSLKFNMPFSTIKWNLKRLKDMNLLFSIGKRGDPRAILELTDIGKALNLLLQHEAGGV